MGVPWTVKHRPKTIQQVAGNKEALEQLAKWIQSWLKKPPKKKAVLLHGPPGVGKTVSAEAVARDFEFDLIEVNASDKRNREAIERILGTAASQGQLLSKRRLILIDEVDGINAQEDRGAADAIVKTISNTNYPIILTANDAWEQKIAPLRNACQMIEFKRLGVRDTIPYLKALLQTEGIEAEDPAIRLVYDRNQGDMRSILNDLQNFTTGRKKLTYADVQPLAYRDRKDSIFQALGFVFSAKDATQAKRAVDASDVGYEMLFEWIYENIPRQLSDPRDMAVALKNLAKADLFLARAQRAQAWELLKYYFDLMTAGVGLSRRYTRPGWIPNKFPERIQMMARLRKARSVRNQVAGAVASKCHISSRRALTRFIPYLKVIFGSNQKEAARVASWLQLSEETIAFLAGDADSATEIMNLAKAES
mgnify:CR=1 FL=1